MSDTSNLIGKLEFIRDYECKTKPEVEAMDEAITKLSAEPERKIYAKMPDAEFEKWLHDNGICNPNIHESIPCSCVPLLIDSAINELPSAETFSYGHENDWIPASERLPEDWKDVLVWFEYFRYGDYNRMYSTYGIGNYSNQYDSWLINHETGWTDLHVFAWMPMPEPPKMEGEQDESN